MLRIARNMGLMEGSPQKQLFNNGVQCFKCKEAAKLHTSTPFVHASTICMTENFSSSTHPKLHKMETQRRNAVKICAVRRRRAYSRTETYVFMEPGQDERFVSEEELKAKLKGWLENWPGKALPPDLARFVNIDDAVSYLVKYVCELEIDGDVGSIQWYEVSLE